MWKLFLDAIRFAISNDFTMVTLDSKNARIKKLG